MRAAGKYWSLLFCETMVVKSISSVIFSPSVFEITSKIEGNFCAKQGRAAQKANWKQKDIGIKYLRIAEKEERGNNRGE
jgi:hypothetical protein